MDMTVSGGGGRSLTKEMVSPLRARTSTLHQLTGWCIISTADRVDMSELQTPSTHVNIFRYLNRA